MALGARDVCFPPNVIAYISRTKITSNYLTKTDSSIFPHAVHLPSSNSTFLERLLFLDEPNESTSPSNPHLSLTCNCTEIILKRTLRQQVAVANQDHQGSVGRGGESEWNWQQSFPLEKEGWSGVGRLGR